ncbi:MAG: lipopolysaccharide biosynthesis protein, partial [Chloroflexaceae bacterium]|nr:lipopolysaccharide biosynthesis protein [Chloroflexaceae bacterium]
MQISEYISVLLKRWWVIGLTALVAAVAAYGVSKMIPQEFRVQSVYLVVANRPDNGLNIVLRSTMNSYRELVIQ